MNNRFPTRRWCIINSGDVGAVNFGQVLENSAQTCRYSVDGTKTFVKYNITEFPQSQGTDPRATSFTAIMLMRREIPTSFIMSR